MRGLLHLLLPLLSTLFKLLRPGGVKALVAENLLLKQQLITLSQGRKRAPNLRPMERLLMALSTLFISKRRLSQVAVIMRPSTLLRLHSALVKRKYRDLFSPRRRGKPGPKGPSRELIAAITEIKKRNPRFGCPRIAFIVSKTFGLDINKDVVRRVLAKHYRPKAGGLGPSWLTFLGHSKDSLWSVDLFRCESITLKSHWVMIVMDQFTRRIIGFGVHQGNVDGSALCRIFNKAIAPKGTPARRSTDNDPLYRAHQWQANLRVLEIEEIKTVPYTPISHPFVERVIGTIRREYLDQTLFWGRADLERKLAKFQRYFNEERVHQAHDGRTPHEIGGAERAPVADLQNFRWESTCDGLVQLPKAA